MTNDIERNGFKPELNGVSWSSVTTLVDRYGLYGEILKGHNDPFIQAVAAIILKQFDPKKYHLLAKHSQDHNQLVDALQIFASPDNNQNVFHTPTDIAHWLIQYRRTIVNPILTSLQQASGGITITFVNKDDQREIPFYYNLERGSATIPKLTGQRGFEPTITPTPLSQAVWL